MRKHTIFSQSLREKVGNRRYLREERIIFKWTLKLRCDDADWVYVVLDRLCKIVPPLTN
jgi:hypothetical protein